MGDRTPFVVGILAIVAVVAWLVLRDDTARSQKSAPAAGSAAPRGTSGAQVAAPAGPTLGGTSTSANAPALPPPSAPTAEDVFAEESRDDAWAPKTELEIAKRWQAVRGGTLESTECRQTQCRLVVTGSEQDVAAAIADLEGSRGLHGFAEQVLLTSPSKNADGSIALRIYARFDR